MRSKLLIALILGLLPVTAMAGDRYGRGYYDRGTRYYGGSRSSFGFSLNFGGGGYYRDYYRPSYYRSSYYAPRVYYPAPAYYYAPPPVVYYDYPAYRSYYYDDCRPSYGFGFYYRR